MKTLENHAHRVNAIDTDNWSRDAKTGNGDKRCGEQYTVYFSRHRHTNIVSYEIMIASDGSFAARRLDTGYIIAGYDASLPGLTIEDSARNVYATREKMHRVYVQGIFSDVMRRIIQEYYQCESALVHIENWEPARFPEGRIRLDP